MARKRRRSSGRKRRRSRKGMSEGQSFMSARGRKRGRKKGTRRRRRGFLSETLSPSRMKDTGKAMVGGAVGGVIATFINKFEMNGLTRFLVNMGSSFASGVVLDSPNIAAGIAGSYSMLASQQLAAGLLKEGYDWADPNVLSQQPQFADTNGNGMYLADDGNLYYLDENINPAYELSANGYDLADNIYPNYVNPANY